MQPRRVGAPIVAALFAGLIVATSCRAQESAPSGERPDEFIVTAKKLEDLRLQVKIAENAVYTRFNDINSDDSHDIHCYDRVLAGTHIPKRTCVSNAWRAAEADIADSVVRGLQSSSAPGPAGGNAALGDSGGGGGSYGSIPGKYRANQLRTERVVMNELRDLANKDPALHEAMLNVGQARQALETATTARAEWTLEREVSAGEDALPFGAKHIVEVRVGDAGWRHPLTSHTFTIASVTGRIRDLRVRCGQLDRKLEYKEEVDWNIPESWSDCTLAVNAKRGTTFALYQF